MSAFHPKRRYPWRGLTNGASLHDDEGFFSTTTKVALQRVDAADVSAKFRAQLETTLSWGVDVSLQERLITRSSALACYLTPEPLFGTEDVTVARPLRPPEVDSFASQAGDRFVIALLAMTGTCHLVTTRRAGGVFENQLPQRSTIGSSRRAVSMRPARVAGCSGGSGARTASEAMIPPSFISTLQVAIPPWRFS
jgi:hypothetical protein